MKLLVTLDFPPEKGGIQRYLHGIVAHTYGAGDRVIAGCSRIPARADCGCAAQVAYVSTPLSRINKKFSLFPLLRRCLIIRLSSGKGLAIECGNVYAGLVTWLLSFFMPMSYAVYTYGTEVRDAAKKTLKQRLLLSVLRRASRLIVISTYTESIIRSLVPEASISMVCPKITLSKDAGSGMRAAPRSGPVRLLCVGRLVRHKGHEVLLDAVSKLPPHLEWRLVIAGEGPLLGPLTRLSAEKGLGSRVEFKTGLPDKDMEREYENASLFVLPSVPSRGVEGFGIVLLEAMAKGLPIVASNAGGIPEVLDNGACGVLVPPGDAGALAGAIVRLAGDAPLAAALVSRARERLLARYVW
jgi:phosphatidylinositol alpha-1,6-mannosyltransferase